MRNSAVLVAKTPLVAPTYSSSWGAAPWGEASKGVRVVYWIPIRFRESGGYMGDLSMGEFQGHRAGNPPMRIAKSLIKAGASGSAVC